MLNNIEESCQIKSKLLQVSAVPLVHIEAIDDIPNGYFMPLYSAEAISSMANE